MRPLILLAVSSNLLAGTITDRQTFELPTAAGTHAYTLSASVSFSIEDGEAEITGWSFSPVDLPPIVTIEDSLREICTSGGFPELSECQLVSHVATHTHDFDPLPGPGEIVTGGPFPIVERNGEFLFRYHATWRGEMAGYGSSTFVVNGASPITTESPFRFTEELTASAWIRVNPDRSLEKKSGSLFASYGIPGLATDTRVRFAVVPEPGAVAWLLCFLPFTGRRRVSVRADSGRVSFVFRAGSKCLFCGQTILATDFTDQGGPTVAGPRTDPVFLCQSHTNDPATRKQAIEMLSWGAAQKLY